jgi:hypothetical protein
MATPTYKVIPCPPGHDKLQDALNAMSEDTEVISVLPDHRGVFMGTFGSGEVYGYLIVVRWSA